MNEGRKKHLAILLIGMLLGFGIGYALGFGTAVKAVAEVAENFVDIDYDTVYKAITQYQLEIQRCYNG